MVPCMPSSETWTGVVSSNSMPCCLRSAKGPSIPKTYLTERTWQIRYEERHGQRVSYNSPSRLEALMRSLFLISLLVGATLAFSQTTQSDPHTSKALLEEVRLLRQDSRTTTLPAP